MAEEVVARRSARGANGEANKLLPEDRPAHNWYRFVLSYPPHLVRDDLRRFDIQPGHRVLDPFCGTGTTLVEAKKLGLHSKGIEANPMAHFASEIKLDWTPDPDGLIPHATRVANTARSALDAQGIPYVPEIRQARLLETPSDTYLGLTSEQNALILTDSISPLPLHKTLTLLDCLKQHHDERYHQHELLALAKALTGPIGNLHFGPEVGVGPAKSDAPVVDAWLDSVLTMADDLRMLQELQAVPAVVHHADARQILQVLEPQSVDAVITSPPYPNEKDYTRTTRLESVLLGFIATRAELRQLKQGLVRSNTRNVYVGDDDDQWVAHFPEIQRIANDIEARRIELGKTSGFERLYAKVTRLYFGGMARHLRELQTILRPGAQLAYVVGDQATYLRIMIPTGQLLAAIAQDLGYEVVGIDLFRTRRATATRMELREEVVVLHWPGEKR